jgi:hypothetical protein
MPPGDCWVYLLMNASDAPALTALVSLVCAIRPDWTAVDVQAALKQPACWERPLPTVAAALILVAGDSESRHPGRVGLAGPWWTAVGSSRPVRRAEKPAVVAVAGPECAGWVEARRVAALAAERAAGRTRTATEGDSL